MRLCARACVCVSIIQIHAVITILFKIVVSRQDLRLFGLGTLHPCAFILFTLPLMEVIHCFKFKNLLQSKFDNVI